MTEEKEWERSNWPWFIAALIVAPVLYLSLPFLNSADLDAKISRLVHPVPLQLTSDEIAREKRYDEQTKLHAETGAEYGQENFPAMRTQSAVARHTFRSFFLLLIIAYPVIKLSLLLGMLVFPVVLVFIGLRRNKLSIRSISVGLLGTLVFIIVVPFVSILLSLILQGKGALICP